MTVLLVLDQLAGSYNSAGQGYLLQLWLGYLSHRIGIDNGSRKGGGGEAVPRLQWQQAGQRGILYLYKQRFGRIICATTETFIHSIYALFTWLFASRIQYLHWLWQWLPYVGCPSTCCPTSAVLALSSIPCCFETIVLLATRTRATSRPEFSLPQ